MGAALRLALIGGLICGGALAAEPPPGATACSGCHMPAAAADAAIPPIAGRDPAAIVAAMQGFRSGALPATIMDRIAKGFTDDEIRAIADWLAARR